MSIHRHRSTSIHKFASLAVATLLVVCSFGASRADAALILGDGFATGGGNYALGALSGQTGTPETGSYDAAWTGSGTGANFGEPQVTASGLSYSDGNGNMLNVSGGGIRMERTNAGTFEKNGNVNPSGTPASGNSVYFSGIMDLGGAAYGWFGFEVGNPVTKDLIGIGVNSSGNGEIRRDGTVFATTGATFDVSNPVFLVGRIENNGGGAGQDRVYLYVDPLLAAEPVSASATVDVGTTGWFPGESLSLLEFRAEMTSGAAATLFDDFRFGESWADVTPFTTAVPEPNAVALVAFGLLGLGLLVWRQRRVR